jgi:hypothetical protein
VRLGAGVIATDENEQTTLYNLAASGRYFSEQSLSLFNMLLDGGDHLDAVSDGIREWSNGDQCSKGWFKGLRKQRPDRRRSLIKLQSFGFGIRRI